MAKNKLTLQLIFGLPLLGLALTTLFYFFVTNYHIHMGTINKGILITPPKQMSELHIMNKEAKPYVWNDGKGFWTFMVAGTSVCDDACQKIMYFVRQTHTALGSGSLRVKMVYLNLGTQLSPETSELFAKEYAHFDVLTVNPEEAKQWFAKDKPQLDVLHSANFYVVDPSGWVMMYYTDAQSYKEVIKDMKFLLKNS